MSRFVPILVFVAGCGYVGLMPLTKVSDDEGGGGAGGPGTGGDDTASGSLTDTYGDADADSDADTDTDADTDADEPEPIAISVERLDPEYGTTTGGNEVAIFGGPFDATATVRFGGTAATVTNVQAEIIVVEAPPTSATGSVEVSVTTDSGEGSLLDAYQYFTDGTGLAGALGAVEWYDMVGTYWSSSATDEGYAYLWFTEPVDVHWWELYAGAMDTCESDYTTSASFYDLVTGATDVTLRPSSGTAIDLAWDSTYGYFDAGTITNAQFRAGTAYDLEPVTATDVPQFDVTEMVKTPSSFTVSSPAISGATPPRISRGQSFAWAGSGGDAVIISLGMVDSAGTSYQEWVSCAVNDDGSFSIPSGKWASWPTDRQVNVFVGRMIEPGGTIPFNNADSRVAGIYWLFGAGFTQ